MSGYAATAFYLLAVLSAAAGFFFWKKAEERLNGVQWILLCALMVLGVNALLGGIYGLIHIPFNLWTVGAAYAAAAAVFWIVICKRKSKQAYAFHAYDLWVCAGLLLLAAAIGLYQFGPSLVLHYATTDPSVHLRDALLVTETQQVDRMYFMSANNALAIELCLPFLSAFMAYKVFILMDVFMLALSGLTFYIVVRPYLQTRFMKIAGLFILLFYLLGYPYNNMAFGFVYLGACVTFALFTAHALQLLIKKQCKPGLCLFMIMLGCQSVISNYLLFAPFVFIAAALTLMIYFARERRLWRWRTLLCYLAVFLLPTLLGLYYSLFGMFANASTTPLSQAALEGYIFRDLYGSFLLFAPFAIYGFCVLLRKRSNDPVAMLALIVLLGIVGMLPIGLLGRLSSYYYFKFHYLFWPLMFYLLVYGAARAQNNAKGVVAAYGAVVIATGGIVAARLDSKINEINYLFDPIPKADHALQVYAFNRDHLRSDRYPGAYMQLIEEAFLFLRTLPDGTAVPVIANEMNTTWYNTLTGQPHGKRYKVFPDYFDWALAECQYITVFKNDLDEADLSAVIDYPRVYENAAGFILQISE